MARPIEVVTAEKACGRNWSAEPRLRRVPTGTGCGQKIILLRLEGLKNEDVAARVGNSVPTVSIWSSRFEQLGLDGLEDKAGRGRKPSIPTKKVQRVITEHSTVQRI